ncbi:primosomal protein N' [Sulfurimonas sp. HSL3-7]|uniref:primosomal protein N' n=1 Tax=Sulfonitrofixus jiaomeiensis TaxID=3131938 RepID=UPI0031F89380
MYFYKIALLNSPLEPLTYQSQSVIAVGHEVNVSLRNRQLTGVVVQACEIPEFKTSEIGTLTSNYYSPKQIKTAKFISEYYICSLGEALNLFVPFLSEECAVGTVNGKSVMENGEERKKQNNTSIVLSKKQDDALTFLQQHPVALLFGDTGSGKTEIYMRYFEDILQQGKRAIFLMPEISLTPQMQIRLEEHFGDAIVMWHSKVTKVQKKKLLERIYNGSAKIIAGARSALFLPVEDLGLIVVDEEHDDSYKSNARPRYNARDMAIYMGQLYKVPVVLGSATPSMSSYVKFPHYRLKGGHYTATREFFFESSREEITQNVEAAIVGTKAKDEQAMLFVPTRANFKYLICEACGHTHSCPYCSVGMSVHHKSNAIKCHYCNFSERIPTQCTKCGHEMLTSNRLGTAEAVRFFEENHPQIRVGQFDRDAVSTQNKLKKLLKAFNAGEIDLLIGTQMLSKGHDYHDVTLAVILGLDNQLNMSDYRAREKALSLLIQIAGRSGRKKAAKVLVQSYNRDFFEPYLNNYEQFLEDEKVFRQALYPPYRKLSRVLFAHQNAYKAEQDMMAMVENLRRFTAVEVIGFGTAQIEKIANKYRFQILLRAEKSTELIEALMRSKTPLAEIDMDPIEFM